MKRSSFFLPLPKKLSERVKTCCKILLKYPIILLFMYYFIVM